MKMNLKVEYADGSTAEAKVLAVDIVGLKQSTIVRLLALLMSFVSLMPATWLGIR